MRVTEMARVWAAAWLAVFLVSACARGDGRARVPLASGARVLQVEIADTPEESARGLMFRKELPRDAGMLFVFEEPRRAGFWMRNTLVPLSIAFLSEDGVVLEIRDMQPLDETSVVSASASVKFAVEANQGWFERNGVRPGDRFAVDAALAAARNGSW